MHGRHLVKVPRDDGNFALAIRRMGKGDMAEVKLDDVCDVMMLKGMHNSINRRYISKVKTSGRYSSDVLSEKTV